MTNPIFEPLTPELQMKCAGIAGIIDNTFNHENMENKEVAFALFLFPMGKEPNGDAVYISGSPREEMAYCIHLWLEKQLQKAIDDQNREAALSELPLLVDDSERKVLLDRRFDDSNQFDGEERRKEVVHGIAG
jgi:hypothetical protein